MKHSRICACGYRVAGGAQCAYVSGVGRQPGPALEVMARIGKPCAPLLRIRPARAAHGLGRQVTTLDHKLAAKLAAPMTREIFIGSVTRATHVRRQNMMVALVTPSLLGGFTLEEYFVVRVRNDYQTRLRKLTAFF
jgi:hypothetical protein